MLKRYAAKLLFQYRVEKQSVSNKRRTVEKRIILLHAKTARLAHEMAISEGAKSEYSYSNNSGGIVYFEFVGVMDLFHLGLECEKHEVWYDIQKMLTPLERVASIIPPIQKLNAVYWEDINN
jgi:hypothetical protein